MGKKKGGKFLASGNNTCVFDPPVKCKDGDAPPANTVSRIVPVYSLDLGQQIRVKEAFKNLETRYEKNFNLFLDSCEPEFTKEDEFEKCNVKEINEDMSLGLTNIITQKQDGDVNNENPERTLAALQEFFKAVIDMNSYRVQVFHADGHQGNISWIGPDIVLHDWEKSQVGDIEFWKSLSGGDWGNIIGVADYSKTVSEYPDDMIDRINRLKELRTFVQWVYPVDLLLYKTVLTDGWKAGRPIPAIIEVGFRFWDILSIIPVIRVIFQKTSVEEHPIIKKIESQIKEYWKVLEKQLVGGAILPPDKKVATLIRVTETLKTIVDQAYSTKGASRTRKKRRLRKNK